MGKGWKKTERKKRKEKKEGKAYKEKKYPNYRLAALLRVDRFAKEVCVMCVSFICRLVHREIKSFPLMYALKFNLYV